MTPSLEIRTRNLHLPDPIAEEIAERARKLGLFYDKIMRCRVTVEGPGGHHRMGRCKVCVDLTVPGSEVVISRQGGEGLAEAIRKAFNASGRRLEDYVRRRRHFIKTHAERMEHGASSAG